MKAHPATIGLWSDALISCLRSPDAAVRKAAVVTVSNVAVEAVESMPDALVRELGARVQDKDAEVARDSTTGLAQIYSGRLKYLWSTDGEATAPLGAAGAPSSAAEKATYAADVACMRSLITASEADRAAALSELGVDAEEDAQLDSTDHASSVRCARADVLKKLHWIPEVIINCFVHQGRDRDLHLRLVQVLDALMLPLHAHPRARARALVQLFASLSSTGRIKLAALMQERAQMQAHVAAAIAAKSDKAALQRAVSELLPLFGGSRAANEAAITRVLAHVDKRVRSRLLQAADATSTTETLNEAKGDIFARLPKSSAEGKMAKALWRLTAMNMVNADMVPHLVHLSQMGNAILESEGVFEWGSGDGPAAAFGALQAVAKAHPSCFVPHEQEEKGEAQSMLQRNVSPLFKLAVQGHPAAAIACLRALRSLGAAVPPAFITANSSVVTIAAVGGAHRSARAAKAGIQALCALTGTSTSTSEFSYLFDKAATAIRTNQEGNEAFVGLEALQTLQQVADEEASSSKRSNQSAPNAAASSADGMVWLNTIAALRAAAELAHVAPLVFESTLGVGIFQRVMSDIVKSEMPPAEAPVVATSSGSRKRGSDVSAVSSARASLFVDGRDAGSIVSDCPKWPCLGGTAQVPGVSLSTAARVAGISLLVNCIRGGWAVNGLGSIHGKHCLYPMQRVVKLLVSIIKAQGVMWEAEEEDAASGPDAIALRMAAIKGISKLCQLPTAASLLQHLQVSNAMLACPAVLQTLAAVVCEDGDLIVRQSLVRSLGKALARGKSACSLLAPLMIACADKQKVVSVASREALDTAIVALQRTHSKAAAAAIGSPEAEKTSMRLASWLLPEYSVFALLHTMAAICVMPQGLDYLGNSNAGDYMEMFSLQLIVLKMALMPMCEAYDAAADGTPFLLAVLTALQQPNVVDSTGSEEASTLTTRVLAALSHGLVRGAIRRDEQATAFTGSWHLPASFFKVSQQPLATSARVGEKVKASLSAAALAGSQFKGAPRARIAGRAAGTPRSATPKRTPGSHKKPDGVRESASRSISRRIPLQEAATNAGASPSDAAAGAGKGTRRSGRSRRAVRSLAEGDF
jgi:hypothetical protein